jgi:homoserine O-succinyltransferase/O-acetyltransferase
MTMIVEPPLSNASGATYGHRRGREHPRPQGGSGPVVIGLINNMPDSALEGTEVQFKSLLANAAGPHAVHLRFCALPEVARGPDASARIAERYWGINELLATPLDGLIVTGTEPRAQSLRDEPYWARLVEILEFAEARTVSSIWSCLAAHAAVLELDGIERRRLPEKRCGVYQHTVLPGHVLSAGLPSPYSVPHSRWNDVPIAEVKAAGYTVLSESPQTGADTFVKQRRSLLVFLQGHPEYEGRTLLKEYQRDVARFVSGQQARYPTLPFGYFDAAAVDLLATFERDLLAGRLREPLAAFPFTTVAATLSNSWSGAAARLLGNWLTYVAQRRGARATAQRFAV